MTLLSCYTVVYLLALGEFMVGTAESIVTGIIDMIAKDTQVPLSLAGQLVTGFSLAFAFGSPLVIAFTASMERKKLLITVLLLFIAGNLLAFISPSFSVLMTSRILLGLSGGVYTVVALAVAANLAPPEKKGSSIGIILMGFSISLVLGVPAGTIAGELWGWRSVFAIIAALSIIPVLCISLYLPKLSGQKAIPLRTQLASLKNNRIITALLVSFLFVTGYSTVYTYITPLLQTTSGMSTAVVSTTLLLAGVASTAGSRIGGFSTDKRGIRPTLYISLFLHAAILIILPFMAQLIFGAMLAVMVWMCAVQMTVPAQQYYLITLSPQSSEIALSVNTSIFQFGLAAGAGMGGLIVNHYSVAPLGWVGGASVLISLFLVWLSFSSEGSATSTTVISK
ncbi:MFS transporter [Aneurinibacillus uraniidurans]|nr:MFS transporter [Aneurinibacillus sp. B1]WCN37442.1 MFS transporter [Aneurinibacillus sp. B1]